MSGTATETETCAETITKEFKPENIGFNYDNPSDFVRSQWPVNQKVYVVYRVVVSLLMIGWTISDVIYESQTFYKEKVWEYLVYASNWSFLLLGITTCFQAICVLFYTIRSSGCLDRQTFTRMPPSLKVQWCLQNLSYNSAVVVSLSYWSFLIYVDKSALLVTDMSHLKHSMNSVYVIVDIFISAVPFRLLHMFYTMMLGSLYSLFNAIYFLNNGEILDGRHYAYNVLKWNHPSEAIVTCVLCLVLAILSQIIIHGMYKFRAWIFSKIYFVSEINRSHGEMQSIITEDAAKYMAIEETPEYIDNRK